MYIASTQTDSRPHLLTLLLLLCLLCGWQTARADTDNPYWTPTSPLPGSMTLYNVHWDATTNEFIAVGELGTILTSADGSTWTAQQSGVSTDLNDVMKGGTTYIAMGWGGLLLTSTDKVTWTVGSTNTNYRIRAIAYSSSIGSGRFVAVGDNGVALYSDDAGVTWTSVDPGTNGKPLLDVLWDGSQFVAVGGGSTGTGTNKIGIILTSGDGITWSNQTVGNKILYAVASNGSTSYVAAGDGGNIYYSSDANTWTAASSVPVSQRLNDIVYDGSRYVAVGGYTDDTPVKNSDHGIVIYSTVGDSWTEATDSMSGIDKILHSVSWDGAGTYVAAGTEAIMSSGDADTWVSESTAVTADNLTGTAFDGTKVLAVTDTGDVFSTTDGYSWASEATTGFAFNDVTWDGSQYVAVVDGNGVRTSADGSSWSAKTTVSANSAAIAFNGSRYVIVGDGVVLTHDNTNPLAGSWAGAAVSSPLDSVNWTGITWNSDSGVFLAVSGNDHAVMTSPTGNNSWTQVATTTLGSGGTTLPALYDVTWNGNLYVAVGDLHSFYRSNCIACPPTDYASVLTSTNGKLWEYHYGPDVKEVLRGIAWNDTDKRFVAVGDAGSVIVSNGADLNVFMYDNAPSSVGTVGDTLTTTVTVQNNSHFTATNVQLVVTLQSDADYRFWSPQAASGAVCNVSALPVITCSLGTLNYTDSKYVNIGFSPSAVGTITTDAIVSADEPEALPADNSTSLTTKVQSIADKIKQNSIPSNGGSSLGLPLLTVLALLLVLSGRRQLNSRRAAARR